MGKGECAECVAGRRSLCWHFQEEMVETCEVSESGRLR